MGTIMILYWVWTILSEMRIIMMPKMSTTMISKMSTWHVKWRELRYLQNENTKPKMIRLHET